MDINRFRPLVPSLTSLPSRRDVLLGLVGTGFGLSAPADRLFAASDVKAKKKRKRKRNKKEKQSPLPTQLPPPPPPPPAFNTFGCLDIGQPCQGNSALCCSGICQGSVPAPDQPDTSVCVAHNAGICYADTDACTLGAQIKCNPSKPNCTCLLTTGKAGFCADLTHVDKSCRLCSTDTDCEAEFGAGVACVVLAGLCTEVCAATGRTACLRPCA